MGANNPAFGAPKVHVDPLVVARGLGEQVDLFLRDGDPVGHGDLLAHQALTFGIRAEDFHRCNVAPRSGAPVCRVTGVFSKG